LAAAFGLDPLAGIVLGVEMFDDEVFDDEVFDDEVLVIVTV